MVLWLNDHTLSSYKRTQAIWKAAKYKWQGAWVKVEILLSKAADAYCLLSKTKNEAINQKQEQENYPHINISDKTRCDFRVQVLSQSFCFNMYVLM